jgi:beta-lactamase superfamily II metal-dependent hydrolase
MRSLRAMVLILLGCAVLPAAKKNLEIYFVDVEGGQATLFVAPSGETMLVDTGWPGNNNRDADRIAAAAKAAGVKRLDYVVVTHYHMDHVGGVPQLAAKMPIGTFVDHGENMEKDRGVEALYKTYLTYRDKAKHLQVKAGDTIPIKGLDVKVVAAAGETLAAALPGAGTPNAACAGVQPRAVDTTENGRSIGLLITFNNFKAIDLGDLTWNKELELACPNNKLGTVDLYISTHHAWNESGSPAMVRALHPAVAIMNNGARKGGTPETWQAVRDSPGLVDIWQLHYAVGAGKEHNTADSFIANVDEICEGKWLHLSAQPSGEFVVTNSRNKFEKTYKR